MANVITQNIRIDLNTGKVIPTAFVHQNDTARSLVFKLYLNGVSFDVSSYTVKFAYVSPTVNGQHTVIAGSGMASGMVSGNKVTVTLPSAYTAISGVGLLTMIITPSSGTIRPVNIRLVVQKSADGDDVVARASDFPTTLEEIANEWFSENAPEEIADIKSTIKTNMEMLDSPTFTDFTWTSGKYISKTTNQPYDAGNTLHITSYIHLPKTTYKIVTNAKKFDYAWTIAFYNANKSFISGVSATKDGYNEFTSIPSTAEYIIITHESETYSTSAVDVKIYVNERLDNAEEDIDVLQKSLVGLNEKTVTVGLQWEQKRRLNVNGELVNASSSFALSQGIDIANDNFYQITIKGIYNITDGSTISIFDANGNVLSRTDQNGTNIIKKSELPTNAAVLYVSQYITTSSPLSNVSITKQYFGRIIDIEESVDDVVDEMEEINDTLSIDTSYNNVLASATTFTDNKFINATGSYVDNQYFCMIDGFFPVKPNTTYVLYLGEPRIYSNAGHNWTFWDENKNFLSYQLTANPVTSPENAAFLRLAIYISNTGTATHANFNPRNVIVTEEGNPVFDEVFSDRLASRPTFSGMKWIGVGDSITESNFRAYWHYWDYVVAETGLNFVNMGVSGSGYKAEGSGNKAFYKRVTSIATDADVITVFGGVNDVVLSSATIGTATDTGTDTICGCVNAALDAIEAKYKAHMPIGVISPLPCACVDTSVNLYPIQNPNDDTCRMAQFVEQLALICKHRGIPFLDLFHQSNLRPWYSECNAEYFSCDAATSGDGLHPNSRGHKLFYRQILDFVSKIVMH